MKKRIMSLLLIVLLVLPIKTFARELEIGNKKYNYTNLQETLEEIGMEKKFEHYEENEQQVPVYLFRGKGCEYCEQLVDYLNSIADEYGKYFKLISFEIYESKDNTALLSKVADYVGAPGTGIPFVVIGNQYFEGYSSEYDNQILETIKRYYDITPSTRTDVMKSLAVESSSTKSANQTFIILWNFVFTIISTAIILFYINKKINKLDDKVSMINNKGKAR